MKLGSCLPKLRLLSPEVLKLASTLDIVSPLDWLTPSVLVFEGITDQHKILKALGKTEVRGHCLIACKEEYIPTIWGGRCRGKEWAGQRVNVAKSQKKALMLNHIKSTIQRFPSVNKWDLMMGNVKPNGELRFNFLDDFISRAIATNPSKSYYLDELLCTSFSRWKTILNLASQEHIAGVGIQIHVNNQTDLANTFDLLKKVLKLAKASNINVDLSEVGYWHSETEPADQSRLVEFTKTLVNIALDYNVHDFIWWGLVHYYQAHLMNQPRITPLFDSDLNPTIVQETLWKVLA